MDQRRNLIHTLPLNYLLVGPVVLAIATVVLLFIHSDVNVALLYSQCHARSRLPWLSHVRVVGAPMCFLVSFFQEALDSMRSLASMSAILSSIAGLLSISTVEAARICNGPNVLIAYPTGPWLVFNLVGGALVWELVIVPAFFHRAKQLLAAEEGSSGDAPAGAGEPALGDSRRYVAVWPEVVAIPTAVAVGFVVPSVLMLVLDSAASIIVWLFFPIYVSIIRQAVRFLVARLISESGPWHLESHRPSLLAVYAVPIVCSAASHVFLAWSLLQPDDRREMTRSTVTFIEIDFIFIALTVLYWVLVEAGWRVSLIMVAVSLVLGPGAGVCIGWIYRESHFGFVSSVPGDADDEEATVVGEDTPLLQ